MAISQNSELPSNYTLYYVDSKTSEPKVIDFSSLKKGTFVIVGVPAAFSPPCSDKHLPGYIDNVEKFSKKSVKIIVVSGDNLFANHAWAKSFGVDQKQSEIIFASDRGLKFIKDAGLSTTEFEPLGEVSSRFALVVKSGNITYLGKEKEISNVTVSAADSVLNEL